MYLNDIHTIKTNLIFYLNEIDTISYLTAIGYLRCCSPWKSFN